MNVQIISVIDFSRYIQMNFHQHPELEIMKLPGETLPETSEANNDDHFHVNELEQAILE